MTKGVVYVVWGDKIRAMLERSIDSVKKHHPNIRVVVLEGDPGLGLMSKPCRLNGFVSSGESSHIDDWVYLDADTIVLGSLDYGFQSSADYGVACCIGECPWLRRYTNGSNDYKDEIEYNTGVIFFSKHGGAPYGGSRSLFSEWWHTVESGKSPPSKWLCGEEKQTLAVDDQWGFSKSVSEIDCNPHVLPLNYNFRPGFHTRFFTPLKVWHSAHDVPKGLEEFSLKHDGMNAPIQWCTLRNSDTPKV